MTDILTLHDIHYAVNGVALIDGVTASFAKGQCTMVLGPNGAGKSLLMKMAHGLLMPSRGSRTWPGQNMTPRHAMVAQRPLMMRRSVHANIVHALALAGMSYAARHARAAQIIRHFRLEALANQPATRLSGGEQQRVAIARAAAIDPAVIFLDEPTAALDPAATREIEDSVQALRASGVTIIMSSHDLPQARRLADSVILLHKGRVIEAGPAADFFRKPQTDEARTFLAGDLLL